MAGWMNEYEVEDALRLFNDQDTPNLFQGALALHSLVLWTNANSDGWSYWPKPSRAANRLQELLQDASSRYRRGDSSDASAAELRAALTPIKAFLTRQGAQLQLIPN